MKIIRPGVVESRFVALAICNKCGCEFEFEKGEGQQQRPDLGDPRETPWTSICCPQTGCDNLVGVTDSLFEPRQEREGR